MLRRCWRKDNHDLRAWTVVIQWISSENPGGNTIAMVAELMRRLREVYPRAVCALDHHNPLQLLVATILSAQCTDKRVNMVTPELFRRYHTARDFSAADEAELAAIIRSTGFYRNKAKNIIGCCRMLVQAHDGTVPQTIEELVNLPGVGRKTANVVLGSAFGVAVGVVVDTHVKRLSARLGLTKATDPEKIEQDLMRQLPQPDWIDYSHLLILHGRARCFARKPDCANCEIADLCPKLL